jgi:sugar phosphate isomerase/epimerase
VGDRDGAERRRPCEALHPRVSVNGMCFPPDSSLADDLDDWTSNGLSYIGVHDDKMLGFGADRAVELFHSRQLRVATLYHRATFDLAQPQWWDAEGESLCRTIDLAAAVGAHTVYITVGTAAGLGWDDACDALARAIRPALDHSRQAAIPLCFESTNPLSFGVSFVHSFRDSIEVAERTGLGVCLDIASCWADPRLSQLIADHVQLVNLVQLCDIKVGTQCTRDRVVPGDGLLPWRAIVDDLLDAGYRGPLDIEILGPEVEREGPGRASYRAARTVSDHLRHRAEAGVQR